MKSVKKSDFVSLVNYLTDDQNKHERVTATVITNCQSTDVAAAALEVTAIQGMNTRAEGDKTYHLIVSFRAGERPDETVITEIERKICEGLGFGEHQRVSVAHEDTDNFHLHIAINKIHPTRLTMHSPYNDHKTLGQLCSEIELNFGLERDNHQAFNNRSENRALDMEHHAGVESLLSWIKRECLNQLQMASSWAELHQVLHTHGLEVKERGNGLVITDQAGLMVKASSVARDLSKGKLVARFGVFKPSNQAGHTKQPGEHYEARPMRSRIDTAALFSRYQHEQQTMRVTRTQHLKNARALKNRLVTEVQHKAQLKRATIKLTGGSKTEKKWLYALTSLSVRRELDHINQDYCHERESIGKSFQPHQWADWLRREATQGDPEALAALRAREMAQGLKGNTVSANGGKRVKTGLNPIQDSVTKKGTLIYRVGSAALRDDGNKLQVSRSITHDGLVAALRVVMERYGSHLTVNGSADFKAQVVAVAANAKLQVTFVDTTLERCRMAMVNHATTTHLKQNKSSNNNGQRTESVSGIKLSNRTDGAGRDNRR